MICQSMGRPPISTIGLGRTAVSSSRREPRPPARITAFIVPTRSLSRRRAGADGLPRHGLEVAHPALGLAERMGADARAHALPQVAPALAIGGQAHGDLHILVRR